MSDQFLIEKRGLYYRPNSCGYTGLKREAGRYSFDDAAIHAGPNGPDGSTDGMGIWREGEAPQFSTSCPWDVKLIEKTRLDTLREAHLAVSKARTEVIHSGVVAYVQVVAKGHSRSEDAIAALIQQSS